MLCQSDLGLAHVRREVGVEGFRGLVIFVILFSLTGLGTALATPKTQNGMKAPGGSGIDSFPSFYKTLPMEFGFSQPTRKFTWVVVWCTIRGW